MKYLRESFESPRQGWDASPTVNAFSNYWGFLRARHEGTVFQFGSVISHIARNSSSAVYRLLNEAYYKVFFDLPKRISLKWIRKYEVAFKLVIPDLRNYKITDNLRGYKWLSCNRRPGVYSEQADSSSPDSCTYKNTLKSKTYLLGRSGRELFLILFCWQPFQKLFPRNYKGNREQTRWKLNGDYK